MFKKILAISFFVTLSAMGSAHAEHTQVDGQFLDDFKNKIITFTVRTDNEVSSYENNNIKVHIKNNIFDYFIRPTYNNQRVAITKEYPDAVYHSVRIGLGGYDVYFSSTGITLDITNKTDEIMYLDLNKSLISIGSYYGKPLTRNLNLEENSLTNVPPIIILPHKTVTKTLYRGDAKKVSDLMNDYRWTVPCDLSLDKNILGEGALVLTIGEKDQTTVSMKFYREVDRNAITKYIIKSK